ncbi:hypothetical protein F2P56_022234 [Juglans regia]|uniref:Glycosyltransferase n=2 Tax=Juglans regia TaxID=51240 RepID=A0A833TZ82_JUGRE|nr:linamarin synthase 2-like [Juglans regia]KAF5458180.1 hypothetical protein F2P56_022234 [Juglans regia]
MDSVGAKKPHAVCVPYPTQGHVIPMMNLAKLLHSKGFHITFVNTEFNHTRLIRSMGPDQVKGLPDFQFETIPDGMPPTDLDATQDGRALCESTRKNCAVPFKELVIRLNSARPPVSCIVSDGMMGFGSKVAEELGIPEVRFWTASACGFMGYLNFTELINRGILPFKDESFQDDGTLDTPINWIPGMKNIRLKDLPSFIRVTDTKDIFFDFLGSEAQNCLNSAAIIFNTFDEFEHEVLEAISAKFPGNIYTLGPLPLLINRHIPDSKLKSLSLSLWKEDSKCLQWLDQREPNSVVYVNYGSMTVMTEQHLKEFAWGLANSKHSFLWIVRPDLVMGDSVILPEEFFEATKDRAFIANWCPQGQVLAHPAVGAFLSHCGWNSMLESICGTGVPVICWPFFAEQQTNCRYACTSWGIGMEVNMDVKRVEVEALVKEMMGGEKGKAMRRKAVEWKKKAEEAADIGGSSYKNFERLIKEALH